MNHCSSSPGLDSSHGVLITFVDCISVMLGLSIRDQVVIHENLWQGPGVHSPCPSSLLCGGASPPASGPSAHSRTPPCSDRSNVFLISPTLSGLCVFFKVPLVPLFKALCKSHLLHVASPDCHRKFQSCSFLLCLHFAWTSVIAGVSFTLSLREPKSV